MPDEEGNTIRPRAPTVTIKHRQRDPPIFTGCPDSDVEDWLKNYERVSQHNGWDDSFKLANVVFALKDTSLRWFDNHEEAINSWDGFKTAFAEAFGQPEHHKLKARDELLRRYQLTTETSTAYIEDVLRLCRRVDPHMSEDDQIRHLFKGLSQQLFSIVAPKSPQTVVQLVSECRKYEQLDNARIFKRPFDRLPEVSHGSYPDTTLSTMIRTIIREELRFFLGQQRGPSPPSEPSGHRLDIQSTVRDELRAALEPLPNAPSVYTSVAPPATPLCAYQPCPPPSASPPWQPRQTRRRSDIWRTDDNRPVCFYCNTPGHVLRYCRRRIADTSPPAPNNQYTNNSGDRRSSYEHRRNDNSSLRPFPASRGSYSENINAGQDLHDRRSPSPVTPAQSRRGRSPSPYPARRRSVSPFNDPSTSHQSN